MHFFHSIVPFLLILSLIFPFTGIGNRVFKPKPVKTIEHNGKRFEVIHWVNKLGLDLDPHAGYVKVIDIKSGKSQVVQIYQYDPKRDAAPGTIGGDIRIFINRIKIQGRHLVIHNDDDDEYHLNLQTLKLEEAIPFHIELTVPNAAYRIKIIAINETPEAYYVLSQLSHDGAGAAVISKVKDRVEEPVVAKEKPIKHYILGKNWAWKNNEKNIMFLDNRQDYLEALFKATQQFPQQSATSKMYRQILIPKRDSLRGSFDAGSQLFNSMVITSKEKFDKILERIGNQESVLKELNCDFTVDALVLLRYTEMTGSSTKVSLAEPIFNPKNKTLLCKIQREFPRIGTKDIAFHCFGLVVDKSKVKTVQFSVGNGRKTVEIIIP